MTIIRNAILSDASRLAQLQEKTFRDTFASDNNAEDMELHCKTHYSKELQEQEIVSTQLVTLICEENEVFSGFAQLKRGEAPECIKTDRPVEIQRLYVDLPFLGKGIAQQLMEHCLAWARTLEADHIWLGVWEHNPRAIQFYKKMGFAEVGEHVFMVGTDAQRDVIMQRAL